MDNASSKSLILVVDDAFGESRILIQSLAAHGYEVVRAEHGHEALALAAEINPHLILLDVRIPDVDGYEICRRLKADPQLRDIPVIFMSGLSDAVDKVKGFQAGGVDYLTKPFELQEVFARVEVHLTLYRQRKAIEHLLAQREAAEAAERQQHLIVDTLLHSAVTLGSTLVLDEVLEHILDSVEQIVPADLVMVILVEGDVGWVARAHNRRPNASAVPTIRFPVRGSRVIDAMVANRCSHVIGDTTIDPLWPELPEQGTLRSFLGTPIFTDERLIGVLVAMALPAKVYSETLGRRLEALAALAAFAIKNARLYEQAGELAAMQERQRLARELHDSISQTLFSANALAEVLPRIIDRDGEKARRYMTELAQFTREAMTEMRSLLFELRPEEVKGVELGILVKQLCDTFTLQTGVVTQCQLFERIVLPEKQQFVFYRVAQETLSNIAKHANATRVDVHLSRAPEAVELRIRDNGCGFDQHVITAGRGINLMAERAISIGARLVVSSQPGQGTEVILRGTT